MPSTTKEKMRETNENILIVEMRNLNGRVAELIKQFSLLAIEIGNVADELEKQQTGVDTCKEEIKDLKDKLVNLDGKIDFTVAHIKDLEKKIDQLDQRTFNLEVRNEVEKK